MEIIIFAPIAPNDWLANFYGNCRRASFLAFVPIKIFARFDKFIMALEKAKAPIVVLSEISNHEQESAFWLQIDKLTDKHLILLISSKRTDIKRADVKICNFNPTIKIREFLQKCKNEKTKKQNT